MILSVLYLESSELTFSRRNKRKGRSKKLVLQSRIPNQKQVSRKSQKIKETNKEEQKEDKSQNKQRKKLSVRRNKH